MGERIPLLKTHIWPRVRSGMVTRSIRLRMGPMGLVVNVLPLKKGLWLAMPLPQSSNRRVKIFIEWRGGLQLFVEVVEGGTETLLEGDSQTARARNRRAVTFSTATVASGTGNCKHCRQSPAECSSKWTVIRWDANFTGGAGQAVRTQVIERMRLSERVQRPAATCFVTRPDLPDSTRGKR